MKTKDQIQVLPLKAETRLIESAINALGDGLHILEAGCGRRWPLNLSVRYRLAGIEPDQQALRIRLDSRRDLDEYQACTISKAEFPSHSFDVIYCSYVLEHVVGVEAALKQFANWIRPGGLIVLRVPDSRSVYGFLARITPHWVHVLVKRHVFGAKKAGLPGFGPYPVVYEPEMSLESIESFCNLNDFSMSVSGNAQYLERAPSLAPFVALISLLSFGYLSWRHCDLAILIRT